MSKLRFDVVQDAFKKKAVPAESPAERTSKYFGETCTTLEYVHIMHSVTDRHGAWFDVVNWYCAP